jgi:hypothetical protein
VFRPLDAKWDDNARLPIQIERDALAYDSKARRLCFDCVDIVAVLGTIRCESCEYSRNRRLAVALSV